MSYEGIASTRILRQSLYTPLAIFCFAGLAGMLTHRKQFPIGWGVALVRPLLNRRAPGLLFWFSTSCWGATLALLIMSFVIEMTCFPTLGPTYLCHVYTLCLLSGLSSLAAIGAEFREQKPDQAGLA